MTYLTLKQFAQAADRNPRTITKLKDAGALTTEIIDGHVYYLQSEVGKAKQVKQLSTADELVTLRKALGEVINKTKSKFAEQAEEIKSQSDLITKLSERVAELELQKTLDDWPDNLPAQPAQNTVAPATPTEHVLPATALEIEQTIVALQHKLKPIKEAEESEARDKKDKAALAKKAEVSKINAQTKLSSTLKGQAEAEKTERIRLLRLRRAEVTELNRNYVITQAELDEMNHFVNVCFEPDGTMFFEGQQEEGYYNMLFSCHHLLTTNRELTHYIKKEYQHLYHVTESGIVDLKDGHSSILDFIPILDTFTGFPVEQTNSHTINIPSNSSNTTITEVEAYPAAWYKFIADHPQPYQHSHNPPDIDLSYTDLLDVTNPADADAYAAAQSVHQQQINKWVRFRQEQGLLP